jgi:hypothetical protein
VEARVPIPRFANACGIFDRRVGGSEAARRKGVPETGTCASRAPARSGITRLQSAQCGDHRASHHSKRAFGGPDVLEMTEVPVPQPFAERSRGSYPRHQHGPRRNVDPQWRFPAVGPAAFHPGVDVSGVVEEVVPGVTSFCPGDEVYVRNGSLTTACPQAKEWTLRPRSRRLCRARRAPMRSDVFALPCS